MFTETFTTREMINTTANALRGYYAICKKEIAEARKRDDHALAYHWQGERNRCAQLITTLNESIAEGNHV